LGSINRTIKRKPSNEFCKIEIMTPGIFKVQIKIFFKDGKVEHREHYLNFAKELREFGIIK
jgi:transcription initiation factor IIF auxiliary subunit